jgi:hypothetical protein
MFYKHLAEVNIHHERGKKLKAYGTQGRGGAEMMHHSYISNQENVISNTNNLSYKIKI